VIMSYTFGILDSLRVTQGQSVRDVLDETLAFAAVAEQLGYRRYWLSENHTWEFASSSPEILVGAIAAQTRSIRVGPAGILLNHYSPLKVAEVFETLANLYPGRIDLGLGRDPGTSSQTAEVLRSGMSGAAMDYPDKVEQLLKIMDERSINAMVWLLGTGTSSAELAARFGSAFAFGNTFADSVVLERYRADFRPSLRQASPWTALFVLTVCARTDQEAQSIIVAFLHQLAEERRAKSNSSTGSISVLPGAPILDANMALANFFPRAVVGSPTSVRKQLEQLGRFFGVNEIVIHSPTIDFASRRCSYELVAETFGLNRPV
jgi:luciferase family oxidoreductase group 1